ncbi:MAG: type IA DNA topoisomerase [Firmicutes bacterium]|nr:type IA DNA topoisomerase [Bacillota bacterium]
MILCEKPSVSAVVAHAVGARDRIFDDDRKNFCYSGNGYYVVSARGHLYGVGLPQDYGYSKNYKLDELPMFPDFRVIGEGEDTESLRKFISRLMNRGDVDTIICATDAGREGELIFRHIYNANHCKKHVKRLWCNSMTDEAITELMQNLPDDSKFDGVYHAALAREYSDWLIGMNLSRLYSIKDDYPHKVGRVKTPVLAIIAERDKEIERHTAVTSYRIELDNGALSTQIFDDKAMAENTVNILKGQSSTVTAVQSDEKKRNRPRLFSLSGLQQEANNVHGFTAKRTLELAQALYEKKLLTYPRTDCECISEDMEQKIRHTVQCVGDRPEYAERVKTLMEQGLNLDRRVMNTAEMSEHDHHAIIPEDNSTGFGNLPDDERKLYELVINRTLMALDAEYSYIERVYTIDCGVVEFMLKAVIPIEQGWKKYDSDHKEKYSFLDLFKGQTFTANAKVKECTTQPPKPYTDSTLISVMNNIDNRISSDDLKSAVKGKGIGTEATRAEIIEQLITAGYIERNGKSIRCTKFGRDFVESLPPAVKSVERTAQWEQRFDRIKDGEEPTAFLDEVKAFVREIITFENSENRNRTPVRKEGTTPFEREVLGKCPRCGKNIYEGKANFYCESGKSGCGFTIWKEQKFYRDTITAEMVKRLLNSDKITLKALNKQGEVYSAKYVLDDNGKYVNFKRIEEHKMKVGMCPRCRDRAVYEGRLNYYCESDREGCGFTLWKNDRFNKIQITPEEASRLIADEVITKEFDTIGGRKQKQFRMVDTGTYVNLKEVQ